eukprot:10284710-Alexandrium_andersonii.AAC.1
MTPLPPDIHAERSECPKALAEQRRHRAAQRARKAGGGLRQELQSPPACPSRGGTPQQPHG